MTIKIRTFTPQELRIARARRGPAERFRTALRLRVGQGFEWEGRQSAAGNMAKRLSEADGRRYGTRKIDGALYLVCLAEGA